MKMEQYIKEIQKINMVIMTFTLLMVAFMLPSHVVYGYAPPESEQVYEEPENIVTPIQNPLTPEGNLSLIDDIFTNNEGDKQFITAVSKSGNWFYIVVDRAGDSNNVHLLNLVDEADLMSLMTGEPVTVDFEKEEPEPEPTPAPEPKVETEVEVVLEPVNSNIMLLGLFAALGGMGLFYYFKIYKKPPPINPLLDDLEEDEEETDPFDQNNDENF